MTQALVDTKRAMPALWLTDVEKKPAIQEPAAPSVDWRGVVWYIAIALGLSWAAQVTALLCGMRFLELSPAGGLLLTGVMFTPALAALVVRLLVTREGFKTAGLRFGSWRYYLAIWLGVPALFAAVYGVTALTGLGRLDLQLTEVMARIREKAPEAGNLSPGLVATLTLVQSMTFGLILTCIATFGEEFGWTGFLLGKLLPLGRWRAAALYGLIWGLWHAPMIIGGYNYPGYPVLGVLMMCVATMALALVQTALRLRSRSVLVTSFFHAAVNSQGAGICILLVSGYSPILGGIMGAVGIIMVAATGALLLARTPAEATV
jgi:uncharacterized protein